MEVNELRIGNKVWYIEGAYNTDVFELIHRNINGNKPELYSGIPLTPEILEKCGFEDYEDPCVSAQINKTYRNGRLGFELRTNGTLTVMWYDANDDYGTTMAITVKYVHQLQNLYFALTQTEINIVL